jgi:MOSC domain-containing protein YiiM
MCQNSRGVVKSLYIANKDKTRPLKNEISLDEKGVVDDKFYAKNLERAILIASVDSYEIAKQRGIEAEFGSLGENILIDINPYGLNTGDKIYIGEVELEITQHCTLCASLKKVDDALPNILKDDRGIFAKATKPGKVKIGDTVVII